ncbi:hypothetical protein [Chromobacterium sp. CV08]
MREVSTALMMPYQGLVGWQLRRRVTHAKPCQGGELAGLPEM